MPQGLAPLRPARLDPSSDQRPASSRLGDDRGGIVAFVALAPVLLLGLLAVIQVAVIGHTRHVATMAAEAGLAETRAFDGSADKGEQRAQAQLDSASGWVTSGSATATRTALDATVTVRASALKVFGFIDGTITVTRSGPVEGAIQ